MHISISNAYNTKKRNKSMNLNSYTNQTDYGPNPYVTNVEQMAIQNQNFRTVIWTGSHMQATLMCIPTCGEIGLEIHPSIDQFIRIEQGCAIVIMGNSQNCMDFRQNMSKNDAVFIPAGNWHNIMNVGKQTLKLSVIYAPPNHPKGTIHRTKTNAEISHY